MKTVAAPTYQGSATGRTLANDGLHSCDKSVATDRAPGFRLPAALSGHGDGFVYTHSTLHPADAAPFPHVGSLSSSMKNIARVWSPTTRDEKALARLGNRLAGLAGSQRAPEGDSKVSALPYVAKGPDVALYVTGQILASPPAAPMHSVMATLGVNLFDAAPDWATADLFTQGTLQALADNKRCAPAARAEAQAALIRTMGPALSGQEKATKRYETLASLI